MYSEVSTTAAPIVIADDHHLVRSALVDLLRRCSDFEEIREAACGQEALEMCRRLKPELKLMDVSMPKMDGMGVRC